MKKKKDVIYIELDGQGNIETSIPKEKTKLRPQILTLLGSLQYCRATLMQSLYFPEDIKGEEKQ